MKNKALQTANDAILNYWKNKPTFDAQREKVRGEYIGNRLAHELGKIDAEANAQKRSMEDAIRTAQEQLVAEPLKRRAEAIKKGKEKALDPANITDDFKFFSLPVKVSSEQLQQLYDRNWDNPLFVKAVQEYKLESGQNPIDIRDPYERYLFVAQTVIGKLSYYAQNKASACTLRDNPHILEQLDATLAEKYDNLK